MEPYDAYRYYMAIKLHFETDDYDAPRYNFKTSVKPQSFWKRKDKYHFAKVGKKFDKPDELVQFYVSQFTNENKWIGDMLEGDKQYADWQKKNQSLSYIFQNDINTLAGKVENFDDLFSVDTHPLVVKEYLSSNYLPTPAKWPTKAWLFHPTDQNSKYKRTYKGTNKRITKQ